MSWAKLFEELDKHGLLDRAAAGIGYALEDWATKGADGDCEPGEGQEAAEGDPDGKTASGGYCGPKAGVSS